MSTTEKLVERVREGLLNGKRDSQLLDGRGYVASLWDEKLVALAELTRRVRGFEQLAALGKFATDVNVHRAELAEENLESAEAQRDAYREALEKIVEEFNLWSEDANDGTYAYYRSDGLMIACVAARAALAASPSGARAGGGE